MEGASSEFGRALDFEGRPAKDLELVSWTGDETGGVASEGRLLIELDGGMALGLVDGRVV